VYEKPESSVFSLGKLNHVAIAVPDLKKAMAFYSDSLRANVSDILVSKFLIKIKEKR